jgi:hypothetical protein
LRSRCGVMFKSKGNGANHHSSADRPNPCTA